VKIMHVPVLCEEIIDFFRVSAGNFVFLDGTIGSGGHTEAILTRVNPNCRVIGIDRDEKAIHRVCDRLGDYVSEGRLLLFCDNYENFDEVLQLTGVDFLDGVVLDLGVSSEQLESSERGFSFIHDGPLDMRMSRQGTLSAYHVVNSFSENELARIFREFGEERYARRIAREIVKARKVTAIGSTLQLAEIVSKAIPPRNARSRIHPATRVFQALRIFVNDELGALKRFLGKILNWLAPGGVLCIVAFHSLEDRIVKHTFRKWANPCTCPPEYPVCVCGKKPMVRLLTRKAVKPSENEIRNNPRARSARLRAVQKL